MKRYKIEGHGCYEDSDGEWYYYEDVDTEIERLAQDYERKTSALEWAYPVNRQPREIPKCNCAEKWVEIYNNPSNPAISTDGAWLCPAHGYKRL